ncbi:MAG: hypothetical protein ABIH23_08790 [bacterium]
MSRITLKTVYVLGAGASFHVGAPLLKDFLVTARLFLEGGQKPTHSDAFEHVFAWIDKLRASSYYVDFDLDNLEHVFSLAEMSKQLGIQNGAEIFRDLRLVTMETLDQCWLLWTRGHLETDLIYAKFVDTLKEANQERAALLNKHHDGLTKDVIITFNYDAMLDYVMWTRKCHAEYCLNNNPDSGKYKVLKLHGSVNWGECSECRSGNTTDVQEIIPHPAEYNTRCFTEGQHIPFNIYTMRMRSTKCDKCEEMGTLQPVIIPPTWSKSVGDSPLANVWKHAVKEISEAYQIIVIGYSLPPTDTFFQYLLTLGLVSNKNLYRVIVVNKDNSEEFKQRYRNVFSRSLYERGRLIFSTWRKGADSGGNTFETFVNERERLEKASKEVEWP